MSSTSDEIAYEVISAELHAVLRENDLLAEVAKEQTRVAETLITQLRLHDCRLPETVVCAAQTSTWGRTDAVCIPCIRAWALEKARGEMT